MSESTEQIAQRLFAAAISDWQAPAWDKPSRVHEWKNYVNEEVAALWNTFTDTQKQALARNAQELADLEEWEL